MPSTHDINVNVTVKVDQPTAKETWDGEGVAGAVVKSDDERRFTLTVAYPANSPDVGVARDGHTDFANAAEVEKCAWDYMLKSRNVGLWHEDGTDGSGQVVESYVYRGPDWPVEAPNGETVVVKSGDWLLGIQWSEDTFPLIKAGKVGGVSMQGRAQRRTPSPLDMAHLRKRA